MPQSASQQVKRPRPSHNCLVCRSRKVKCGREQPECANCRKMGRRCEYQAGVSSGQSTTQQQDLQAGNPMEVAPSDQISHSVPMNGAGNQPATRQIANLFFGINNIPNTLATNDKSLSNDPFPPHIDFLATASVLKTIPAKSICDTLLEAFMSFVYPMYPLIDTVKFQAWYVDFWRWADEESQSAMIPATLLDDVTGNCLLFAVLYAGAYVTPSSVWAQSVLRQENKDALVYGLKIAYMKTLSACDHINHPTISSIASELVTDPFMERELDSLSHGLFVSSIGRLAQSIGLHLESTLSKVNERTQQHRRRIWDHIVWLDMQYSIASGLPLSVGASLSRFGTSTVDMSSLDAGIPDRNMISVLLSARSETTRLAHTFLFTTQNSEIIHEEAYREFRSQAREINSKIWTALEKVPTLQRGMISDEPRAYAEWTRNILTMSQSEIFILLETPFLRVSSQPELEPELETEQRWTRAAHLCALYLQVYLAIAINEALYCYTWFLSRCAAPTHCTYLLLVYLRQYPHADTGSLYRHSIRDVIAYWDRASTRGGIALSTTQTKLKQLYGKLAVVPADAAPNIVGGVELDMDI
ncbi:hypothetical protein BJX70DRAFT_333832 [Aspergillus crustosus]